MTPFPPATETSPIPQQHQHEDRLLTRSRGFTDGKPGNERGRRWPGIVATSLLLLAGVCIICLIAASLWMRSVMHAALPQIDGSLRAPGASAPVRITRDEHGVPSIEGGTADDVLFAQGFVTAQDRLWQMDALRRHAAGQLAEILGSRMLAHDRTQRTLQVRTAAERALGSLPADQRHQLDVYARGVNAWIESSRDHLPLEFRLLHYRPAPWTAVDCLLVELSMVQDLSTGFPTKLAREILAAHLPAALLADLYPVGSWRDHPPGQAMPDLTSPRPEIEQVPLDETQTRLDGRTLASPAGIAEARTTMLLPACSECRAGSNNWAVSGAHTASGAPLVSNDMHLGLAAPDIWYEAGLHTTDRTLDVMGVTLPGVPFVLVGRNQHVAWAFTNLGADTQDLYVEHLRGSGRSQEFERPDGSWAPVQHHVEHIGVRGSADVTLDIVTTQHAVGSRTIETPIISGLFKKEQRPLALAWSIYDPASITAPFLAADEAKDGAALTASLAGFGAPCLNLVYGDDAGHIGYHAIGRIPIRGAAVQHPVAARPDAATPENGPPPPPDEDEGASSMQSDAGGFVHAAWQRTGKNRRQGAPSARKTPGEDAIPAPSLPPAYTIGSPIPPIPVDGTNPDVQWSGYVPFEKLLSAVDPAAGFVVTANARVAPDGYPYALTLDWIAPYRVERIVHLLAGRNGLNAADMLRIQMDVHSEMNLVLAQRLAYAVDHSRRGQQSQRLQAAADLLRRWNGNVDPGTAAPAIVAAVRAELWPMLLVPHIEAHDRSSGARTGPYPAREIAGLYFWGEQDAVLESLVTDQPARWLPQGFADWNDLLSAALERGLRGAPGKLSSWKYGNRYPLEIRHPLLSTTPFLARLLGVPVGSGPRAVGGNNSTISAVSLNFGPSERFTADLSSADSNTLNITTGQSGNPASPWYLDHLPPWINGNTFPAPLHGVAATHTLILEP